MAGLGVLGTARSSTVWFSGRVFTDEIIIFAIYQLPIILHIWGGGYLLEIMVNGFLVGVLGRVTLAMGFLAPSVTAQRERALRTPDYLGMHAKGRMWHN